MDFTDFLTLSLNYGMEVDTYGEGDTNCNGVVDFDDFLRFGNSFGSSAPQNVSNVPEPQFAGWLSVMIAWLLANAVGPTRASRPRPLEHNDASR